MVREKSKNGLGAGQGFLLGRPGTNVQVGRVDLDAVQSGGMVMQNVNALPERLPEALGTTAA